MDDPTLEAFGYTDQGDIFAPESYRITRGIDRDTLQPVVILFVRYGATELGFQIDPDGAEAVAHHLVDQAEQARATSLEPS